MCEEEKMKERQYMEIIKKTKESKKERNKVKKKGRKRQKRQKKKELQEIRAKTEANEVVANQISVPLL